MGMGIKVWNNCERNIKLDQAEFIDTGPLSRDSVFTVTAQGEREVRKGSNSLVVWLEHGPKVTYAK